jgi:hypothetical protein
MNNRIKRVATWRAMSLQRFGFATQLTLWLVTLILLSAGSALAQNEVITVDAAAVVGTISPYVYGANADSVISLDLMPHAQALGLKMVRLGGNRSDQQDLNKSNLDIFILQAQQMGAEPLPTVRLLNGSAEKAADIVRYANIEKEYNIRYWSIGNEPSFFVSVHRAESYTTEDLNQQWRAIAEAMLAVDPNIIFVGPDISQYVILEVEPEIGYLEGNLGGAPRDAAGRDWMQEFLSANGDLLGVVSVHRYPYPGAAGSAVASATIEGLAPYSREWDTSIPNLRQVIRDITGRDIPIAVTEFNSNSIPSSGGEAGLDSHFNAIWIGDVLGRLIRNRVEMALYWDLRSVGNGFGLMGQSDLRPSYYTYLMYTHFGSELLETEASDSLVSYYAALNDDGALTLMVINLGMEASTQTLSLANFTQGGAAQVWRFDPELNAEQLDDFEFADGTDITLPGQSMTLYVIPAG